MLIGVFNKGTSCGEVLFCLRRSPGVVESLEFSLSVKYYFALALGTESLPAITFSYSASMTRWIVFRASALAG